MARPQLLAGFHAVEARLREAPESIQAVYLDAARSDARMRELQARLEQAAVRCIAAPAQRLRGLAGDLPHQGVVALCRERRTRREFDEVLEEVGPSSLLLLLDGVTDPRNLGACLRTAAAAGVDAVIVPRDRSASLSAPAARAAAGAAESVDLVPVTNLARAMRELRDAGVRLIGAAGDADRTLYETELAGPLGWVLGAEGSGLRRLTRESCDAVAAIPLVGEVESLNISVATGICLFETVRRRLSNIADPG